MSSRCADWLVAIMTLTLAACVATLAGACGGGGQLPAADMSPRPTAANVDVRVVTDQELGFRLAYPEGWVESVWQRSADTEATNPLEHVLAYADPKGARAGDAYVDAEQLSIYKLSHAVSPGDIDATTALKIAGVALADLPGLNIHDQNIKSVDVAGVPGWHLTYDYQIHGKTVTASTTLIAKEKRAYVLTLQASTYTWSAVNPTLGACLRYFRLL